MFCIHTVVIGDGRALRYERGPDLRDDVRFSGGSFSSSSAVVLSRGDGAGLACVPVYGGGGVLLTGAGGVTFARGELDGSLRSSFAYLISVSYEGAGSVSGPIASFATVSFAGGTVPVWGVGLATY